MLSRIFVNTRKHILRSGWVGWASVLVMTLAFLVITIFGGLAYVANLQIQYIESKSNMLVFFDVGMDPEIIQRLQTKWDNERKIKDIIYINEEEAFNLYSEYTSRVLPEYFQILNQFEEKRLPSSLEIQLYSLDDISEIQYILKEDIATENKNLEIVKLDEEESKDSALNDSLDTNTQQPVENETDNSTTTQDVEKLLSDSPEDQIIYKFGSEQGEPPITLEIDDENLERMKEIFLQLRVGGVVVIGLLVMVVAIFIFMTTEFRLYNQKEEIGVMQLVGGSLFFIRSPYVLEGGFYGFIGALLSSIIIIGVGILLFVVNKTSELSKYIYEEFGRLPWPTVDLAGWSAIILVICIGGFLIGTISSYLSIRRYIR